MSRLIDELVRRVLLGGRLRAIEAKRRLYDEVGDDAARIRRYQLDRFNEVWQDAYTRLPFYRWWRAEHGLPERITALDELRRFPPLTKADLRRHSDLVFEGLTDYTLISTGGTSGITTRFPTSRVEADAAYANSYLGRGWWGIEPLDRILMLWGHSHLFGQGAGRHLRRLKRDLSDWLIHTRRISSYALSPANVAEFVERIKAFRPEVIISYTSNVFQVCKYLESKGIEFDPRQLRCVILTSESVTDADAELITRRLHVPVVQEYGMVESGPIAYSHPRENRLKVFWDSFIVGIDDERLYLSTIGPRLFPLIRYDSEDIATTDAPQQDSILVLNKITGKARHILDIPCANGETIQVSTFFFDHILKYYQDIYSIHFRQKHPGIAILLTSDVPLDLMAIRAYLAKEALREYPQLRMDRIEIAQLDQAPKTLAGKNQTLLSDTPSKPEA